MSDLWVESSPEVTMATKRARLVKRKTRRNPPLGVNDPALAAAYRDATQILGRPPRIGRR